MARRSRTARPRGPRRSALAALLVSLAVAPAATAAPPEPPRHVGQVTDTLRTPTHRLLADRASGRALADLVFMDRTRARTAYRACVKRRDATRLRTCYSAQTGSAGVPTITPLRFPRGRYAVTWSVAGDVVARWRFRVIS